LHSYANPENELKIAKTIKEIWPEAILSISHKVAREFREYERTSTTVIDAYIKKNVAEYLSNLSEDLDRAGFNGQFLIVTPNGVISVDTAKEETLRTVASGPIGGAAGAAHLASSLGINDALTLDIGGTSADVSIIKSGINLERHEAELMGYPVLNPGIDVRSTGAGGGSIARVDSGGILTVGPQSAGGYPGPMCYGLGGNEPTVTDAAIVNGLIDPSYFVGGDISLDVEAARKGIDKIAKQLGLNLNDAADGILKIATDNITNIVSEILVGQGYDPRDFAIISYGGAGGIFVGHIANNMGISRVIIPRDPGVFSAYGMLTMNFVHSFVQSYICFIDELDTREIENIWGNMKNRGMELLAREGIPKVDIEIYRSIDMQYEGQGHYVEVPVSNNKLNDDSKKAVAKSFHQLHKIKYGHQIDADILTANIRLKVVGKIKKVPANKIKKDVNIPKSAIKPKRRIYLEKNLFVCAIYERDELLYGNTINGPAIIEEPLHTLVVMPDQCLIVDEFGNLIINKGGM
jgi:N-methylhydantoinase A